LNRLFALPSHSLFVFALPLLGLLAGLTVVFGGFSLKRFEVDGVGKGKPFFQSEELGIGIRLCDYLPINTPNRRMNSFPGKDFLRLSHSWFLTGEIESKLAFNRGESAQNSSLIRGNSILN
jgi:hypothetical protein